MENYKRYDYLDSIRGLSAFSVLYSHAINEHDFYQGNNFGVNEFFLLSSFLLTYQLMLRYENKSKYNQIIIQSINYLIMRFFRVYIPFIIFILFVKLTSAYGGFLRQFEFEISFKNFLLLNFNTLPHHTYLWTIPVECKFYLIIPFISLIGHYLNLNYILAIVQYLITLIIIWNLPKMNVNLGSITSFLFNMPVFLIGCSLAILIKSIDKHHHRLNMTTIITNRFLNNLIDILTFLMFLIGARLQYFFNNLCNFGVYWSIHMLLMLIGAPNNFTNILANFKLLKLIGKYSYGFYLFHGSSMTLWDWQIKNVTDFINIPFYKLIILTGQALLFGFVFYNLIENNCIKLAKKINVLLLNKFDAEANFQV